MSTPVSAGALVGGRQDLVVYLATTSYFGPAGTDRHIADQLSRHHPVLFVDPPVSVMAKLRGNSSDGGTMRSVHSGLTVVVPWVTPGITRPGLHHLVAPLIKRATRAAVATLYPGEKETPVAAVITTRVEGPWSVLPTRRTLFYATDDLASGADLLGLPVDRLLKLEGRTLREADVIAAVSTPLRDRYMHSGYAVTVVPNGCEPAAYAGVDDAPIPGDVTVSGPIAGLVGIINERIDLGLLEAVADTGASLLLVGPVAAGYQVDRFAALTARPNVCWVGAKPFAELPGYLRLMTVGLTPYADSAFNRASFPLKTLEYLAAGRAVVSTPLPANDWLATDLITVAGGPADFARRVAAALAEPHDPAAVGRRREFAAGHSWAGRAAVIAELAGLPTTPGAAGPRQSFTMEGRPA